MKSNQKKILFALALAASVVLVGIRVERTEVPDPVVASFGPATAEAQTGIFSNKSGTTTDGMAQSVWNTIDSVIIDGTILMTDTTSVIKRGGVRPYDGTLSNRKRCVGIAWNDVPKSSQNTPGKMLVYGYHANAKLASGTATSYAPMRISAVHGAFINAGDSTSMTVGLVLGATTGIARSRYTCKLLFYGFNGHQIIGAL